MTNNGWISVEDRLPDENTRVLVFIPYTDTKIDTDRILNGKWVRWIDKITHWQPLPEPPEEEQLFMRNQLSGVQEENNGQINV